MSQSEILDHAPRPRRRYTAEQLLFFKLLGSKRPENLALGKWIKGTPWGDKEADCNKSSEASLPAVDRPHCTTPFEDASRKVCLPSHIIPGHDDGDEDRLLASTCLLSNLSLHSNSTISSHRPSADGCSAGCSADGASSTSTEAIADMPCRPSIDAAATTATKDNQLPAKGVVPPLRVDKCRTPPAGSDVSSAPGLQAPPGNHVENDTPRRFQQHHAPSKPPGFTPRFTPRVHQVPPPGNADPAFIRGQVKLLESEDSAVVLQAATRLAGLAASSDTNAQIIAEADAVSRLLKLLANPSVLQVALDTIDALVCRQGNDSSCILDAVAAGAPRLVRVLGSRLSYLQYKAAGILQALATGGNPKHQKQLVDAGGPQMLVALLKDGGSYEAVVVAANTLQILAKSSSENQRAINKEGAAPQLLPLLSMQKPEPQIAALGCLVSLAVCQPDVKAAVADAGGIPPVCRLLQHPGLVCQAAAGCLQTLCVGCPANIKAAIACQALQHLVPMLRLIGQPEAQSNAACCIWALSAGDVAVKLAFLQAGAMNYLLPLLTSDNMARVRHSSAGAIWAIVNGCPSAQHAAVMEGAVPLLVDVLCNSTGDAPKNARGALLSIVKDYLVSPEALANNMDAIVACLTRLMACTSVPLQTAAAKAMQQVMLNDFSKHTHLLLLHGKGVQVVVHLLKVSVAPDVQVAAAGILQLLAAANSGAQEYILKFNAAADLKVMLRSSSPAVQDAALKAMRALIQGRAAAAAANRTAAMPHYAAAATATVYPLPGLGCHNKQEAAAEGW